MLWLYVIIIDYPIKKHKYKINYDMSYPLMTQKYLNYLQIQLLLHIKLKKILVKLFAYILCEWSSFKYLIILNLFHKIKIKHLIDSQLKLYKNKII